jgi:hypothetical protein
MQGLGQAPSISVPLSPAGQRSSTAKIEKLEFLRGI